MRIKFMIISLALFLGACKSKNKISSENINKKYKIESTDNLIHQKEYQFLSMRGKGDFFDGKTKQSFRVEIRIKSNEMIWVDVSDPFLGIKVARALITPNEFSFYNRLEKNYMKGDLKTIYKYINKEVPFAWLNNLLVNKPITSSKNLNIKEIESKLMILFEDLNGQFVLHYEPNSKKIESQSVSDLGYKLSTYYNNFQNTEVGPFPFNITFGIDTSQKQELNLEWNKINFLEELDFPFSIPQGYVQIQ